MFKTPVKQNDRGNHPYVEVVKGKHTSYSKSGVQDHLSVLGRVYCCNTYHHLHDPSKGLGLLASQDTAKALRSTSSLDKEGPQRPRLTTRGDFAGARSLNGQMGRSVVERLLDGDG